MCPYILVEDSNPAGYSLTLPKIRMKHKYKYANDNQPD